MSKISEPKFSAASLIAIARVKLEERRKMQAIRGVKGTTGEVKGTPGYTRIMKKA